jgi:hypothetical protein
MTFAGPKKRGGQRAKLSTRMDGAWDEAVVLDEDGGSSDGVGGSSGGMASDKFPVFDMFKMLDDRGKERIVQSSKSKVKRRRGVGVIVKSWRWWETGWGRESRRSRIATSAGRMLGNCELDV